jgi:LysM domain
MKRMTIFPSRSACLAAFAALGLGVLAVPEARAQQAPAAPSAPPPSPAAQASTPPPATHIVQQGETLWALAQQFYGDPLFWPEIYRLNTSVIEDPHWIFPGEELHLTAAPAELAAAPAAPAESAAAPAAAPGAITVTPAAAADTMAPAPPSGPVPNPAVGPTVFSPRSPVSPEARAALRLRERNAYRAVREGEFRSAGFLLEQNETLSQGRVLGNMATSSISRLTTTTSAQLYSYVAIVPPPDTTFKAGDLLESVVEPRTIPGYGSVVVPTGLLKVTSVDSAGGTLTAQVVAMFSTIASGQGVIPAPVYRARQGVRPVPVPEDSAITGTVIDLRTPHELAAVQNVIFLDRGSADGVQVGDIFDISGTAASTIGIGQVVQEQAKVLVVFTRQHVSSAIIVELERPDIRPGSSAREIYRMPS